jgi:hypothetical protein
MKTIQTKAGELLLIKVPELAFYFDWKIKSGFDESIIIYYETEDGRAGHINTDLLAWDKFEIINKFSQLEDKDLEDLVEQYNPNDQSMFTRQVIFGEGLSVLVFPNGRFGFRNYMYLYANNYSLNVKESFQSLCKSQGIEDDLDNYLIIKKV